MKLMPQEQYEAEAEKILAQVRAAKALTSSDSLRVIAEALEQAEKRGREISARLKESSG
jgi:hypothetical protein